MHPSFGQSLSSAGEINDTALTIGNYLFHSEAIVNKNGDDCKVFHKEINVKEN